jgi:hypothetical protein
MSAMDHRDPEVRALDHHQVVSWAHWAQLDMAYELRTARGFALRSSYGVAWMMNPGDATCEHDDGTPIACDGPGQFEGVRAEEPIFTFSVSVGYALPL